MNVKNWIGNHAIDSLSGNVMDNINPATMEKIGTIPLSDEDDLKHAILIGEDAFKENRNSSLEQRVQWLEEIADGIEERFEEFVQAESLDTGKPIALCRKVDVPRAISNFKTFAKTLVHLSEQTYLKKDLLSLCHRRALGLVAVISPWNLPIYLLSWKLAPAIA